MRISDWSSDVCSSDLLRKAGEEGVRDNAEAVPAVDGDEEPQGHKAQSEGDGNTGCQHRDGDDADQDAERERAHGRESGSRPKGISLPVTRHSRSATY